VHLQNGTVTIRAHNKQFLCAENGGGGNVVANRKSPGGWETFRLNNLDYVPPVQVQYVAVQPQMQQQQQQYYAAAPPQYAYGQAPPQYGQAPPQYGQAPPQYGQAPPQYGQAPPQYGSPQQQQQPLAYGAQYAATGGAPPSPYANAPPQLGGSGTLSPNSLTGSGGGALPRVSGGPGPMAAAPQDFVSINPGLDSDAQAAHNHIGDFCVTIQALDKLLSDKLNPSSHKKSLLTLGRGKGGSQITLSREDKNSVLASEKKMLEEFNLFLFDWNRYSKQDSLCVC
jgi:hypothetical protein